MATRREIRSAFYDALESATDGLLPADSITEESPDNVEDLPTVVHSDNYRPVPMNTNSAPVDTRDEGTSTVLIYSALEQARFDVTVVSVDEDEKEDIYQAIVDYFEPFEYPIKDESTLQADVSDVTTGDVNSNDQTDRDPIARGDTLRIDVQFEKFYEVEHDDVSTVNHAVDADTDGTTDNDYTTT